MTNLKNDYRNTILVLIALGLMFGYLFFILFQNNATQKVYKVHFDRLAELKLTNTHFSRFLDKKYELIVFDSINKNLVKFQKDLEHLIIDAKQNQLSREYIAKLEKLESDFLEKELYMERFKVKVGWEFFIFSSLLDTKDERYLKLSQKEQNLVNLVRVKIINGTYFGFTNITELEQLKKLSTSKKKFIPFFIKQLKGLQDNRNLINKFTKKARGYDLDKDIARIVEILNNEFDKSESVYKNIKNFIFFSILIFILTLLLFYKKLILQKKENIKQLEKVEVLNNTLNERVEVEVSKNLEKEKFILKQSKMAAMGEMIDAIAHQWKQPLSVIGLTMSSLKLQTDLFDNVDKVTIVKTSTDVIEQVDHLVETIDEFRQFYRPNVKKEHIEIASVINSVLEISKKMIYSNTIAVEIIDNDRLKYDLIPTEFKHVILNLIGNAKDAFVENKIENRKITINIYQTETKINISVEDNAGGIPEHIINKVFESNFTTKEEEKGTGIGLYMSNQIIQKLDGKIKVKNIRHNVSSKGCRFIIELPLV